MPNSDTNAFMNLLTMIYSIFFHATVLHMAGVLILEIGRHFDEGLQAVTFHIANMVVYFMASLMTLYFQLNHEKIKCFMDDLNKSMHARSAVGFDYATSEANFRLVEKIAKVWTFMVFFGKLD